MAHPLGQNPKQSFLLPQRLDDFLPEDHIARFVDAFVEALDFPALGIHDHPGGRGRPFYPARMLLALWLLGYIRGITSCRELERACRENVAFMWLARMTKPDHNTLWRFWTHHRSALAQVFKKTTQLACEMGLVRNEVHAIDGTKIEADAAHRRTYGRKRLQGELERIQQQIEAYMKAVATQHEQEKANDEEGKVPERLKNAQDRKAWIEAKLAELEAEGRNFKNDTDPDALVVKTPRGKRLAYNAQLVVDAEHQMAVAGEVLTMEADSHALPEMLDRIKETIGTYARETLTDKGYFSGKALQAAQERGCSVIVPLPKNVIRGKQDEFLPKTAFTYDEAKDQYFCPYGGILTWEHHGWDKRRGYRAQTYRCRRARSCTHRFRCSRDPRGRSVKRTPFDALLEAQRQKQQDPEVQAWIKKRRVLVEPPFGMMKRNMGWYRFTVRGLRKVRAQWFLILAAYNMKKMHRLRWMATPCGGSGGTPQDPEEKRHARGWCKLANSRKYIIHRFIFLRFKVLISGAFIKNFVIL